MRQRHSNNSNHDNGINNEKGTIDTFYSIVLVFVTSYVYRVSNISYTSYEIIAMADVCFGLKNSNPKRWLYSCYRGRQKIYYLYMYIRWFANVANEMQYILGANRIL